MTKDQKASETRVIRNILFIIIFITFAVGSWRILSDTTLDKIPEAEKVFKEEKNLEK